jgi:hypothetical protein
MNTDPNKPYTATESGDAENYEQIPPPDVLVRQDEDQPTAHHRTDKARREAQHSPIRLLWTHERWQTLLTGIIAFVTSVYAATSFYQLKTMREGMRVDNRAWVGVESAILKSPVSSKENPDITINLINAGKTPALNLHVIASSAVTNVEITDTPTYLANEARLPSTGVMMPGVKVSQRLHGTGEQNKPTETEWQEAFNKGAKLKVWGVIEYEDIFGQPHRTRFCFINQEIDSLTFDACTHHNDAN